MGLEIKERHDNPFLESALRFPEDFLGYKRATIQYGYVPPTEEVLDEIAVRSPNGVVEIGAGNGYWANQISLRGVSVVAFDIEIPESAFFSVQRGDETKVSSYANRTLLLCWPDHDNSMAADTLRLYQQRGGSTVIYVGEPGIGCTATEEFRTFLYNEYEEVTAFRLPVPWPYVECSTWNRKT